jgi:DNA-binding NarL/FixJ family response regulator
MGKQKMISNAISVAIKAVPGKTFIRDYSDLGRLPQIKEQIIEMSLNGSGIRDIARVLKISPTTVIEEIKKRNRAECCKYRFAAPA